MRAEEELRKDERLRTLRDVQGWIDANNVYRVEFGHYEPPLMMKWIPLQTHRINLEEVLNVNG